LNSLTDTAPADQVQGRGPQSSSLKSFAEKRRAFLLKYKQVEAAKPATQ
jgi:hypothetical protein